MIWPAIIIGWTVLLYTKYQYYFAAEHNAAAESQNTSTARCAAKLNRKKRPTAGNATVSVAKKTVRPEIG